MDLRSALKTTFREADDRTFSYGAVAIDADGTLGWGKSTEILLAAWHDGRRSGHTLDLAEDTLVETRAYRTA